MRSIDEKTGGKKSPDPVPLILIYEITLNELYFIPENGRTIYPSVQKS
jgi:hypothetical protein